MHRAPVKSLLTIVTTLLLTNAAALAVSTLRLDLTSGQGPAQPGELVQVKVSMTGLTAPAAGFQAFLHYDTNELTFINAAYTRNPFGMAVLLPIVTTPGGDIDLASGINQFAGQQPSAANAPLCYILFQSVHGQCQTLSVQFRPHDPPTRLSTMGGGDITPLTLIGLQPLPVTCPADIDHDNDIDIDDLLVVILGWGQCPPTPVCCEGDISPSGGNGVIDIDDLLLVILAYGQNCPP